MFLWRGEFDCVHLCRVMAKRIFDSEHEATVAKQRAALFTRNVLGDGYRADEIEDESLDGWLEETGRRIIKHNPQHKRKKKMAQKTRQDLLDENKALQDENDALNERLNQIFDLAAEPDEEDYDSDDFEDEDG